VQLPTFDTVSIPMSALLVEWSMELPHLPNDRLWSASAMVWTPRVVSTTNNKCKKRSL